MDLEQTIWTQERLERMVHDQASEHLNLEFKAAPAAEKREIISKSISGLANADGGVVIFGMKEHGEHKPKKAILLDPINPSIVSKERLDDIITSNIKPKIQGTRIHAVTIIGKVEGVCYVVEVPRSHTVHQAEDNRYYRRRNFKVEPMEDYEVREGIMRSQHPVVKARIRLKDGAVCVEIENEGIRLAKHFAVRVESPTILGMTEHAITPTLHYLWLENGNWQLTLPLGGQELPLFPGERRIFSHPLTSLFATSGKRGIVKCTLFADEMPFRDITFHSTDLGSDWIEW